MPRGCGSKLVARFNDLVTSKLSGCLIVCLAMVDASAPVPNWMWPGCSILRVALGAQAMARSGRYDVLITLGAVIRGDATHLLAAAEAGKAAAVSRDTGVPVTFGVLTTDTCSRRSSVPESRAIWVGAMA